MRTSIAFRFAPLALACVFVGSGCGPMTGPDIPDANYVRFESDAGEFIGQGQSYEYTQATARIRVSSVGGSLEIQVSGDEWWRGSFSTGTPRELIKPGTYTSKVYWFGEGRGCTTGAGSFTVEHVSYENTVLRAIDLSFQRTCMGVVGVLRGQIHWRGDDPTQPPRPVLPIPDALWRPDPGTTPASGTFVRLESDPGDRIGRGVVRTYLPPTPDIHVHANGTFLTVEVNGADYWWVGQFQAMNILTRFEPGYYPDLHRYPFHNPVKGGLMWDGSGSGCNEISGWFAIDDLRYVDGELVGLTLRFEQQCSSSTGPLRGMLHWEM